MIYYCSLEHMYWYYIGNLECVTDGIYFLMKLKLLLYLKQKLCLVNVDGMEKCCKNFIVVANFQMLQMWLWINNTLMNSTIIYVTAVWSCIWNHTSTSTFLVYVLNTQVHVPLTLLCSSNMFFEKLLCGGIQWEKTKEW